MSTDQNRSGFLRVPQVLALIPTSRSTWWAKVKTGEYPAPVKLSERVTAWRRSDIEALCARLGSAK